MMQLETYKVAVVEKPFGMGTVTHYEVTSAQTVADVVEGTPKPEYFDECGLVLVDDVPWPESCWDFRAPPGSVITLSVNLEKSVGKILLAVASIVLVVATAGLVSLLTPVIGGFLANIVGAAVGLLGTVAIGALFRPSSPGITGPDSIDSGIAPGSASISGNVLPPGGRLARCLGYRRIFPAIVAPPYHEIVGEDDFVTAGFALAGPHAITSPRLGETLLADTSHDLEYQASFGLPGESVPTLLNRQVIESNPQITLTWHSLTGDSLTTIANQSDPWSQLPKWSRVTSREDCDEIWLILALREGLFDDNDPTFRVRLPIRFRMRMVGDTDWINLPEVHIEDNRAKLLRKMVKFIWAETPSGVNIDGADAGFVEAFSTVPAQTISPAQGGWQSDAYWDGGSAFANVENLHLDEDRVEFYIDEATYPKGQYEIEVIRGIPFLEADFSSVGYTYNQFSQTVVYDFFGFFDNSGTYRPPEDSLNDKHSDIIVAAVSSIWNEYAATDAEANTLFAIKAKNRVVEDFSVVACGLVPDWDGADWSGLVDTNNPAPHLRDIWTGLLNLDPIAADELDDTAFIAWRAFCDSESLEIHAVAEQTSVDDAMALCVSAGRAIVRASDTWGVAWEHDRSAESPVQVFSERNSNNFQWSIPWDRIPDALLATYLDEFNKRQQILVYADGVTIPNRTSEVVYEWIDNETDARRQATLDLRMAQYRANALYTLDVPIEGIVCQRGDLVGIQHDTLASHAGKARIVSVASSGGNITGVTLDSELVVINNSELFNELADVASEEDISELGLMTGVAIRKDDGSIIEKALTGEGNTKDIVFETPFADSGDIGFGNLIVAGPLASEYSRKIVFGMELKDQFTITLTLLDEAPELLAPLDINETQLFTDVDEFYAPAVVGNQEITPPLFTESEVFYSPDLYGPVYPSLFTEDDEIFDATVTQV